MSENNDPKAVLNNVLSLLALADRSPLRSFNPSYYNDPPIHIVSCLQNSLVDENTKDVMVIVTLRLPKHPVQELTVFQARFITYKNDWIIQICRQGRWIDELNQRVASLRDKHFAAIDDTIYFSATS